MGCETNWGRLEAAIQSAFDAHAAAILIHIEPLRELMQTDPDRAADCIPELYEKALDTANTNEKGESNRALVESMVGPSEDEGRVVSNIVGCFYPFFDRERQDRLLGGLFRIYDMMNSEYVNGGRGAGITEAIHEPLLLRDIGIARLAYWPGLDEGARLLEKYPDFTDWQERFFTEEGRFRSGSVESEFLVAYRLLRSDSCSFSESFAACAEPEFLARTVRAIVGLRFGGAIRKEDDRAQTITERTSRLKELLPASLHAQVDSYREERAWVDWKKFNPHGAQMYDSLM